MVLRNKLTLNVNKTKVMFFGTAHTLEETEKLEISYQNTEIEHVSSYKYLGMMLDPKLTFSDHVEYLRNKSFGKIRLLGKLRPIMDRKTALVLYQSIILPQFDYCDFIYDVLSQKDAFILQKLQNVSLRIITNGNSYSSVHRMHNNLDVQWLDERRKYHGSDMTYKVVHGLAPPGITKLFTPVGEVTGRVTRSSTQKNLYVDRTTTRKAEGNFKYRAAIDWYSVPADCKTAKSLRIYKKSVRNKNVFVHDDMG